MIGYCCYAYFQYCDPWRNDWIAARDQIVPYLSLYMFATIAPGVAGIYLSAVFGASLSTCSSTINSCSVIVIEDILKPYFNVWKIQKLSFDLNSILDKQNCNSMDFKIGNVDQWSIDYWVCLYVQKF